MVRNQWVGFSITLQLVAKLYMVLKCSGYRKFVNAEDIYTTLLNNEIVELKPPPVWVDQLVLNTANTTNMGYDQKKMYVALALGYMEYFMNSSDEMRPETEITEEWNEECKMVRE